MTIGRLRRKLGGPPVIITTPGVGYRSGARSGGGPGWQNRSQQPGEP